MNEALLKYVRLWIEKAGNDLDSAKRLLEIEPYILDNACFHCQQAIEKYLKAFLIFNEKDIQKTHDVNFLLEECATLDEKFRTIDLQNINLYAVAARYPDTAIAPELQEAKYYYQLALQIREMILILVQ